MPSALVGRDEVAMARVKKDTDPIINKNEVRDWISSNIKIKVCNTFIQKEEKGKDPVCFCGYLKKDHTKEAKENIPTENEGWKNSSHTVVIPTNAYGDIEVTGHGQKMAKYVRIHYATDVDKISTLLLKVWELKPPNIVISVTGGAKNFHMRPRLKEVLRRGLMKAAASTAWIVTGGMHAGVMKAVGEAVQEYRTAQGQKAKVVTIGIAPWQCVNNKEQLIDPKGRWPAIYRLEKTKLAEQSNIDTNHSHFFLVDNGTPNQLDKEMIFRARLEKAISQLKTEDDAVYVPAVCLVLEGGPETLKTVKSAIDNRTPAVVVEGSGGAADVLAYAYAKSSDKLTDILGQKHMNRSVRIDDDDEIWEEVAEWIKTEFDDEDLEKRLKWVKDCLRNLDYVTVFKLNESDTAQDLDVAILRALLKVNKADPLSQLKLALAWNRIDVAKSDIFLEDKRLKPGDLHNFMYLALMQNQVEFVKLFMETGLGLQEFLTVERMTQMYDEIPKKTLLYEMLERDKNGSVSGPKSTLEHIGCVIKMLMGDLYVPLYLRDKRYTITSEEDEHRKPDVDEPARELFIWCVLLNRLEMAKIFWDEGKEGVAAALVAQTLINSMLTRTKDSELQQCMRSSQEHFEKLSVECLNECYASDGKNARLLLVHETHSFGKMTVLQLAVQADNKIFIAHSACQALLNNIWRRHIALDVSNFSIWLSVLCPPLLFFLIRYSEDDGHQLADERRIETKDTSLPLDAEEAQSLISENSYDTSGTKLTVWQRIKYFYNAPMITFIHNCLSYMTFLIFYSILLLTRFNEAMDVWDYLLIFWVVTLFAEEIRQVATGESSSIRLKLANYLRDEWNILDAATILSFLAGVILRLVPASVCPECFDVARIVLAINLMTFCFRILHIFSVHQQLGPKLVMIRRMMVDLFFFIIILIVFITAFGLASQAILYPNSTLDWALLRDVFKKPYWQMYGELYLEELEGDVTCTSDPLLWRNGTQTRCPHVHWIVPALLGVYILITNVLMLNLLIAMFSYTFNGVQSQTDQYWHFQRYFLIKEYHDRPSLSPPLIFLSHVFIIFRFCVPKYRKKRTNNDHSFKKKLTDDEEKRLVTWENMCAGDYLRKTKLAEENSLENQVKVTRERVDQLCQATTSTAGNTYQEDQMRRTAKALDWIICSMVERGQGPKTGPPALVDIDNRREEKQRRKQVKAKKAKEENQRLLRQQLECRTRPSIKHSKSHGSLDVWGKF